MKNLCIVVALVAATSSPASAAPERMSFTGRISASEGLVEGPVDMTFAIFDSSSGGTMLWEESHSSVVADQGLVFVNLGSTSQNGLGPDVFSGDSAFLEVTINGETLAPRSPILSVPYATKATRADVAASAELLGTLAPEDVADKNHTHAAADIVGALGDDQIACYADLLAEGHLDGNASTDLLTIASGDARFLNNNENHFHSASEINAGVLNPARFDSYSELADAGRIDGNAATDLMTRSFSDGRFLNVGEAHNHSASEITAGTLSTSRYDAYNDLSVSGRLDLTTTTDLVTRGQGDGRYLRSGDSPRFYGCGTYVYANFCPAGNTGVGPNCDDVPAGSFCEADGECGLSTAPNCGGVGAWYFKQTE